MAWRLRSSIRQDAEAYLNEMGFTSMLFPDEVVTTCNIAQELNSMPELLGEHGVGLDDAAHFARYIRTTMAPPRDHVRAASDAALRGSQLFDQIGCSICHVRTLTTARA
jgi:CxxC motif-containing protein (DUF1111 family)